MIKTFTPYSAAIMDIPQTIPKHNLHGGVPGSSHSMHNVAAVFDRSSGARITRANVVAHIFEPGGKQKWVRLQPMTVAGALTFGGYTTFARGIYYRIGIRADRPPHMQPPQQMHIPHTMHRVASVTAHFSYIHD